MSKLMSFGLVAVFACHSTSIQAQAVVPARQTETPVSESAPAQAPAPQPPHTPSDHLSFRAIARDLGRNFRDLPTWQNASLLGVGGGLSAWVHSEDAEITHRWSGSPQLDRVFEPGAVMGSAWVQLGGAVGTYVVGRSVHSPRTALLGADLLRSQAVNMALTQGIKLAVRRQRPDGTSFSFPSGHSSATFTTATVLERHFGWNVGAPAYALATLVAGSRLQENRHYLSDVLFGAAIGIVSGRTATIGRRGAAFRLSPTLAPGVVGLTFTHVPRE